MPDVEVLLFSIQISQAIWHQDVEEGEDPANWRYVAHVDGLSISEGPLVDVRPK